VARLNEKGSTMTNKNDGGAEPGSRRGAAKLLAGAIGLGLGMGIARTAHAARMVYLVDGKEAALGELPVEIEDALAAKKVVEILTEVDGRLYRANFKVEIEG